MAELSDYIASLDEPARSVVPSSAAVVEWVPPLVPGFSSTKGGIRFTDAQPLPADASTALVTARRHETDAAVRG